MKSRLFLRLWTVYHFILPSTSLTFDIERGTNNNDLIPNNFASTNGTWRRISCRSSCHSGPFNTDSQASGICRCTCKYSHSTFRMAATPEKSSCIKNQNIRNEAGCKINFESFSSSNQVPVLRKTGLKIQSQFPYKCRISGKPQYWDRGRWLDINTNLFMLETRGGQYLKWISNNVTKYTGRLMRQYIDRCKHTSRSCLVFKAPGTLKYDITMPTTSALATTAPSTTVTTTVKLTTQQSTTVGVTSSWTQMPSSPTDTSNNPTTSTPSVVTDAPVITEEPQTEATDVPTPTSIPGGEKDFRGGNSSSDNSLVVTIIAAVAAILCVIIICVFVWCGLKRMRRRAENRAYSSDMKVITNATGTNNTMSDSTIYCEPTPLPSKQHSKIGNPVYNKVISHGHRSNNYFPKVPQIPKATNYHDNHAVAENGEFGNPTYQDVLPLKQVNSEYDNYYYEPEKPIYEELPASNARESTYQPLVRDSQVIQNEANEIPEYLAILNDDPACPGNAACPGNEQSTPEYLAIIPDNDESQSEPPSLQYDYAIPEDQQTTPLKAPNSTGLIHPMEDSSIISEEPVYNVLEAPGTNIDSEYMEPIDESPSSRC